ncbi:DUF3365 domain-containing protein, partial [Thermodesulfobacteriota bacterium]
VMSLIIGITFTCSIFMVNRVMKMYAQEESAEKARILLDRNLAIHTYFSHQLKPVLFKDRDGKTDDEYFEPVWMSSTYAVREIDKYYQSLSKKDYYYKEAAINARSPQNEADIFEHDFINKLNESSELNEYTGIKIFNGKPFLVVLKRGESMEEDCLRCHSSPETAPAGLVSQYGSERSFQRNLGEVVSAISIRIPLGYVYKDINRFVLFLSFIFGMALLIIFGLTVYLGKRWLFDPLDYIRMKFNEVIKNPEHLGKKIERPSTVEIYELTETFNQLSFGLRAERDELESRVAERTEKLNDLNNQLLKEVEGHMKTIDNLELTLKEVKTLSGLLPICAHCKKIRDDKGYWQQVESYIGKRSGAEFSHGICPDCIKEHYPEIDMENE